MRREDQIVSFVQLGEAGRAPVVTAIDRLADDIHVVRRSMIGAETGIFRHAASELRKYEHRHIVRASNALPLLHETRDSVGYVREQPLMQIRLLNVRVAG